MQEVKYPEVSAHTHKKMSAPQTVTNITNTFNAGVGLANTIVTEAKEVVDTIKPIIDANLEYMHSWADPPKMLTVSEVISKLAEAQRNGKSYITVPCNQLDHPLTDELKKKGMTYDWPEPCDIQGYKTGCSCFPNLKLDNFVNITFNGIANSLI